MAGLIPGLILALAVAARAQSPMPYGPGGSAGAASDGPPSGTLASTMTATVAPSTATVSASTETASGEPTSGKGIKIGGSSGEGKPKLTRPIHAIIHAEAKDWEPLSLKAGGDPGAAETRAVLAKTKVKGKDKGAASKAKATARLHKIKDAKWLVISVHPKALERKRTFVEVRLKIVEGYIENVKAAAVTIVDRRPNAGAGLDTDGLRREGVEFQEESPASGEVLLSAVDPRPSKTAVNSGTLKNATFGDADLGRADIAWAVTGLAAPK